jgi:hypothetical protein
MTPVAGNRLGHVVDLRDDAARNALSGGPREAIARRLAVESRRTLATGVEAVAEPEPRR